MAVNSGADTRRLAFIVALCIAASLAWDLAPTLPAQVHVATSGTDVGDGRTPTSPVATITYALTQAIDGEEIRVAAGDYPGTITVVQDQLITGDWLPNFSARNNPIDPSRTFLTASDNDRVLLFQAATGETLTLDGLTFSGGNASTCAVRPGRGGGICSTGATLGASAGSLVLRQCHVRDNIGRLSVFNDASSARGGGIYAELSLTMEDCVVEDNIGTNVVRMFAGDLNSSGGSGGGIHFQWFTFNNETPKLELTRTTIRGNIASSAPLAQFGGLVEAIGGGMTIISSSSPSRDESVGSQQRGGDSSLFQYTFDDVQFLDNRTRTRGEGPARGGGLFVDTVGMSSFVPTAGSRVNLTNCTFDGNIGSNATIGLVAQTSGEGGGAYMQVQRSVALNVTGCTVRNNISENLGGNSFGIGGGLAAIGGNLTVRNSLFADNLAGDDVAAARGGAIDHVDGPTTILRSRFNENQCATGVSSSPFPQEVFGGAVYHQGSLASDVANIAFCSFSQNRLADAKDADRFGSAIVLAGTGARSDDRGLEGLIYFISMLAPQAAQEALVSPVYVENNAVAIRSIAAKVDPDVPVVTASASSGSVDNLVSDSNVPIVNIDGATVSSGPNITTADPQFGDPINNDLHPAKGSPVDGAGVVPTGFEAEAANGDLEANPLQNPPNAGAFETFFILLNTMDFGDAIPPYPTSIAEDGARHTTIGGPPDPLRFGLVDEEADGQATIFADGDDAFGIDDEEGAQPTPLADVPPVANCSFTTPIVFIKNPTNPELNRLTLNVTGTGVLNGWIDFGSDQGWGQAGDQFITNSAISAPGGSTASYLVTVPPDAAPGLTYMRLRASTAGGLAPTGLAPDGEVEDYLVYLAGTADLQLLVSYSGALFYDPGVTKLDVIIFNNGPDTAYDVVSRVRTSIFLNGPDMDELLVGDDVFYGDPNDPNFDASTGYWYVPVINSGESRSVQVTPQYVFPIPDTLEFATTGRLISVCNIASDPNTDNNASTRYLPRQQPVVSPAQVRDIIISDLEVPNTITDVNGTGNTDVGDAVGRVNFFRYTKVFEITDK